MIIYQTVFEDELFALGVTLKGLGRIFEAEKVYRSAIELDPDLGEAHYNLALLLTEQNRLPETEQPLRETIRVFPAQSEPRYNLGVVLMSQGRGTSVF